MIDSVIIQEAAPYCDPSYVYKRLTW